jgi:SAM-dependent methyltransferase
MLSFHHRAQKPRSMQATDADFPDDDEPLSASWTSTDGAHVIDSGFEEAAPNFLTFSADAYAAMRDDEARTPLFAEAVRRRLHGRAGELVVADVGTGPFAVLALMAARAGARRVFAIEANPEAARQARAAIQAAADVPAGMVEVIEGFSTQVTLPCKVDLLIAEIVGEVRQRATAQRARAALDSDGSCLARTGGERGGAARDNPRRAAAPRRATVRSGLIHPDSVLDDVCARIVFTPRRTIWCGVGECTVRPSFIRFDRKLPPTATSAAHPDAHARSTVAQVRRGRPDRGRLGVCLERRDCNAPWRHRSDGAAAQRASAARAD